MGLIACINNGAIVGRGPRNFLIDVLRALAYAIVHPFLGLEHFSCTGIDLTRHQERNQLLRQIIKIDNRGRLNNSHGNHNYCPQNRCCS